MAHQNLVVEAYPDEEELLQRISVDPEIRFGKPIIRGMRLTVGDVLGYLAAGMTWDEILYDFPYLEADDIRASLAYAARLMNQSSAAAA